MSSAVEKVLRREDPERFVYAPNYWQWFAHHRNHGLLPPELAEAGSQLDMIRTLGLDVFSRNIYCDEQQGWFGGLCNPVWEDLARANISRSENGKDIVWVKNYEMVTGHLAERLRYDWAASTLEQEEFLLSDYESQKNEFDCWLKNRRLEFDPVRWNAEKEKLSDGEVICAGEVVSPLKMLHLVLGAEQAVYFLMDEPELAAHWMTLHHGQQIAAMRQMLEAGVPSVMAMDNLDTQFHPPHYVEAYSAAFYEEAAALCHQYQATFWIHACGMQRANLDLIRSLGVDGLEGVAFPPIGDVTLREACAALAQIAPLELAQSWDNVGLLAGDLEAPVRRVLLANEPLQAARF